MKLVTSLFKQDPIAKQLKKAHLTTDNLTVQVITKCLKLFEQRCKQGQQQSFLKCLIKQLQQKNSSARKIKVMIVVIQVAKISKYDVCDIVLNKKIKVFTRASKFKHNEIEPKPQNLQHYICEELLIPMYNYLMKLSTNQQLYHTCKTGEIPFDDIFRRGTKIRFIWIFKLYNIISIILPILQSIVKLHHHNPTLNFFAECATYLFNDLAIMNNFVVKALEEASTDNFMLMPYFDMLQFHQSLNQQVKVGKAVNDVYDVLAKFSHSLMVPLKLSLTKEEIEEIQIQALRVKLISNSLKNPKKDHTYLQTEYNQKLEKKEMSRPINTQPAFFSQQQDFKEKWKHLD